MRTLIVEDDPDISEMLKDMLTLYGPCNVAQSGSMAISLLDDSLNSKEPYDLLTVDIGLPDIDGQVILKKIRDVEKKCDNHKMKVIMISGRHDSINIHTAFLNGCDGYIIKPFNVDQLTQKLIDLNLIQ